MNTITIIAGIIIGFLLGTFLLQKTEASTPIKKSFVVEDTGVSFVQRFYDGDIVCYKYIGDGISCVKYK